MSWFPKQRRSVPGFVAVAVVGTAMLFSASGSDRAGQARWRKAPVDGNQVFVDEAYYEYQGPLVPGHIPGAPLPEEARSSVPVDEAVPADEELLSVLVYMKPTLTRNSAERANVKALTANRGGLVKYEYTTVLPNVLNLRNLTAKDVKALKKMPGVAKVEEDVFHANVLLLHDSTPLIRGLQSQITAAGLSADGTGVRICVVDTGIDMDHIMYASRIDVAASYDFHNNDPNPDDDHGHGSHVSGIALGGTGISWDPCSTGSIPFQGVAPNATLIGAKVLNASGGGLDSNIIAGIDHCADQSPSGGRADVINMSIGTGNYAGICTHSWAVAANNAVANGVVAVAASGNENNSNSMGSPACGVDVIAVGMTWKADYPTCEDPTTNWNWGICTDFGPQTDEIGCFSNESDFLDVSAPGANIWSASNAPGGSQITGMSGTSMASPQVAGLVALVLDVDPTLTPAEVRQIIRDGAIDMGPAGFDRAYGYGRIDVIDTLNELTPCTGDPDCDDGLFCNGAETCVAQSCQAGTDPCPGQSCDEGTDQCVASPTMQYEWTMNTNPGWTTQGLWAWGQPTGGGGQYGGPDPTSGYTGSNVYGYNLNGDYENNLPERQLTTTVIDCTDLAEVSVKFRRWLGVEVSTYDHAYVGVSNNGSTWTTVWQNSAQVAETAWSLQEYDISSVADGQPTVYVRWTMGTTDSSWQFCGWNIDDVEIWGRDTGGGCSVPADCDDGLWCNGAEDCVKGSCVGGTAPNCNDGVGCTDDSCNEGTDSCDNVANDANCDNGLYCDGAETCHVTLDCQSGTAVNCDDAVGCTDDSCNEGTDSCDRVPNDGNCDNGVYCDGAETCHVTMDCQAGSAVDCDDAVGCTDDSCNEGTDSCDNVPNAGSCDNGLYCDGVETCHATLDCQAGTAVDCDDGVGCTDDSCNEGTDSCDSVANNANCDNGLYCDGAETCHATLDCQSGTAIDCDDAVGCTDDSCNEGTDSCDNVANDANCDNGLYCDGAETCNATLDCQDGTAVNCDDGVGCTSDSCNEGTDSCDNVPNNAVCDNGLYCDGAETCHVTLDCQSGTTVNCNDGVGCTDDSCNEGTDSCDNVANDANCDNGLFCDGSETCHATLDCQAGSDPCPGQICDEGNDLCTDCVTNGDCDDGLYCNGAETCSGGTCLSGTAVNCDDAVGCTADSCNETTDSCDNIPNDASCDNGLYCDGSETCHATLDCQAGAAVNCGDGVGCTDDSCNEGTDSCDNIANDANCDNGLYCDGSETCHATLDCQAGSAVNCGDGVGCTDDSCNETTDSCDNTANDANCDDTLFCNGAETCHATLDCQAGSDPCPGEGCDEGADVCIPVACNNNGTCEAGEDCNNCPNDCISGGGGTSCGDGICQPSVGEDCRTCDLDCRGKLNGNPSRQYCCGDDVDCTDSRCNADPWVCDNTPADPYCCGDETCEGIEDNTNCAVDCPAPYCGDTTCDPGEDQCNCPADCGTPPATEANCSDGVDNDCDGLTDGDDPDCECGVRGDPCAIGADCCSGDCKRNGTCK